MPHHHERRSLPHSAAQMYDLVADVRRYPEFLPWVSAIRIRKDEETEMLADMVVGFKSLRETFTSRVEIDNDGSNADIFVSQIGFDHDARVIEDGANGVITITMEGGISIPRVPPAHSAPTARPSS